MSASGPMSEIARIDELGVEELQARIGRLVRQRQELRAAGASADRLESNRRRLVRAQRVLGAALIERYERKPRRRSPATAVATR